jgi:hypothetical protein
MLDDFAGSAQRREHIDKAKQLRLELFIAHRERHHPLIKGRSAEKRFRMLINQLEDARPTLFDLALERSHLQN